MDTYSKQIEAINKFIEQINKDYEFYGQQLQTKSQEVNDLEHEIELDTYDEFEKKARALRKVLKERRESKDIVGLLQPMIECLDKHKSLQHDLADVLGKVRKEEKYQNNRKYKPKVRTDMTIRVYK